MTPSRVLDKALSQFSNSNGILIYDSPFFSFISGLKRVAIADSGYLVPPQNAYQGAGPIYAITVPGVTTRITSYNVCYTKLLRPVTELMEFHYWEAGRFPRQHDGVLRTERMKCGTDTGN